MDTDFSTLLPTANATSFDRYVEAYERNEGAVNGLWLSMLNKLFSGDSQAIEKLEYFICPEMHHKEIAGESGENESGFSDLIVEKRGIKQLVYEGKGFTGEDVTKRPKFDDILKQLIGYASDMGKDRTCYLIGARGRFCKFWKYKTKDDPTAVNYWCLYVKNGIVVDEDKPQSYTYSIIDRDHQEKISTLLKYIKANSISYQS
ncbi:hypothetical protein H0H92_013070 [Tricholoma furcatifolium]|nr:hypothetical protein H0H92_013070 [Tricholoma furcatifolium]